MKRGELALKGKKVLVVGLARSGVASACFLAGKKARVTVTDIRNAAQLESQIGALPSSVRLQLGGHETSEFVSSDLIVLSPGVPSSLEPLEMARREGIPVISEVELAYRFMKGILIGITGSNGKTTTTSLLGELLRAGNRHVVVAGNIGRALIHYVEEPGVDENTTFVVELSSFQLENIDRLRCQIALLLNITPDHLDRYADFDEYASAKTRIFENQGPQDCAVLNADDDFCARLAPQLKSRIFPFSRTQGPLSEGVFVQGKQITIRSGRRTQAVMEVSDLPLRGLHNLENALAATAAGFLSGLQPEVMASALRLFPGVEHRLEFLGRHAGVSFYNDSKATNVDSTRHALESFQEPLILIVGGKDKGGDFESLRDLIRQRVRQVILIGAAADRIEAAWQGARPISRARSLEEAVQSAFDSARPGDVVLLSPACASFDMFQDYEHRGRAFKQAVSALMGGDPAAASNGSSE